MNTQRRHTRGEGDCVKVEAAISQGIARIASNHPKLGRDKEGFFLKGFRGSMALPIP